jgi:riboflavin synthase
MFTGIITDIGKIKKRSGDIIIVSASETVMQVKEGDSVSVNGVCLTVASKDDNCFYANVLSETAKLTNLGKIRIGDPVNLELAVRAGDRLGGHVVSGHVDCIGKITRKFKKQKDLILEIEIPPVTAKKIAKKGSIALNGISLTVAEVFHNRFTVHIIPHTVKNTNLNTSRIGDLINVETDKYFRE